MLGWEEFFIGLDVTINGITIRLTSFIIGAIAFWLLFSGSFKRIVNVMTVLVGVMSIVFVTTAVVIQPDITAILKGLFIPKPPQMNFLL